MKRREVAHRKRVALTLERWNMFYSFFSSSLNNYLTFGRVDMRKNLAAIENLFAAIGDRNLHVPICAGDFVKFKLSKFKNSEMKKALREIWYKSKRQQFRNLEILDELNKQMNFYIGDLKNAKAMRVLLKEPYFVGFKMKIWKERRLEDALQVREKIREGLKYVRGGYFINEIESYIDAFVDLFENTLEKLENMDREINKSLSEYKEIIDDSIVLDKEKKCCLKLPSWDLIREVE